MYRGIGEGVQALLLFGVIGIVVCVLAVLIGVPWLLYWLWTHLQWIS